MTAAARHLASALLFALAPLPAQTDLAPSTSRAIERLDLGHGRVAALRVDSLGERIALRLEPGVRALGVRARLCPRQTQVGEWLYLHCTTARFHANADLAHGTLDLIELRGLPFAWDDSGPPRVFYEPSEPTQALRCPGETPAALGECALRAGDLPTARRAFLAVTQEAELYFAALRLGDLAEMAGDPEKALASYGLAAAGPDPLRSLARLRRCELVESECRPELFQLSFYGPAFRREVTLRIARYQAFHDHLDQALARVAPWIGPSRDPAGGDVQRLIHKLLTLALDSPDEDLAARGLELYLTVPDRLTGVDAALLARSAAEAAGRLGVPRFGANLLAAAFPEVPAAGQPEHLLRTAELYLDGGDLAHAEAILDFAHARLASGQRASPRWRIAERQVEPAWARHRAPRSIQASAAAPPATPATPRAAPPTLASRAAPPVTPAQAGRP